MTWGDFQDCISGYNDRVKRVHEETDMLNHILGRYVAYAVNNPKKYPKKPLLLASEDKTKEIALTDDQRIRMARLKYNKKD